MSDDLVDPPNLWKLPNGRFIRLLTAADFNALPDGTQVYTITGKRRFKTPFHNDPENSNYIDKDTRWGFLAFGMLCAQGTKPTKTSKMTQEIWDMYQEAMFKAGKGPYKISTPFIVDQPNLPPPKITGPLTLENVPWLLQSEPGREFLREKGKQGLTTVTKAANTIFQKIKVKLDNAS